MNVKGKYFRLLVGAGFGALLLVSAPALATAATAPPLGVAQQFGVLGNSAVTGSTGSGTVVNGDVGSSPTPSISNFPPSSTVPPFIVHNTGLQPDGVVNQAHADAITAYNALLIQGPGTVLPDDLATVGALGPGVYSFTSGAPDLPALATLTLNDPTGTGIFVFNVASALTANVGSKVVGTANPCNIYWRVGTSATLNGTIFWGTVIADASITVGSGANLAGRALAGTGPTGAVTMAGGGGNTIGGCSAAVPPSGGVALSKAFVPATINPDDVSILTITLSNANLTDARLTSALTETFLPGGVVIAPTPNASTTCGIGGVGGGVVSATPGGATVSLSANSTIPGGTPGICSVTVNVTAPTVGSFLNTLAAGALQATINDVDTLTNTDAATATLTVVGRPLRLNDSTEPGSVIVFPKFIRGQVTVDGVPGQPRSEFAVGVTCPPNTGLCAEKVTYKIKFHWVCGTDENPLSSFICVERNFEAFVTMNGKIIFNTEGTTGPGNFVATTPPCQRGYLVGWVVDLFDQPIKFDGLIGEAVLRESSTAVMAYKGYTIQADPALANNARLTLGTSVNGLQSLVFDGAPGHYLAATGVIISDVEYDKTTAAVAGVSTGSHSTNLTLLTLDVHSNQPNYPTFVPLKFWSAQEDLHSTSVDFVCWTEIGLLGFDPDLTSGQVGSRKGVMVAGPARKFAIGGILGDTAGPATLIGLVDTLEGPTAASPACAPGTGVPLPLPCIPIERTSGNERSFMYEVYNDSVPVPTQFVPFPF